MPPLPNSRHERFAQEVAKGSSDVDAFEAAGYSRNRGNATRLKANESVRARIEELLSEGAERAGVTIERVVSELAKIGFADIRGVVAWRANVTRMVEDEETGEARLACTNEVQLIDSAQITDDMAAAISEISQTDKGALKVKLHDKLVALEKLGKHLGMFRDRVEHSGPGGGPIEHAVSAQDLTDDELAAIIRNGG